MNSWTVTLPPETAEFVNQQLAKKAWDSADLLFAYAIDALQNQIAREDSLDQDWLRSEVQKGLDSLDRGEGLDGPTVMAKLRQKLHSGTAAS